MNRLYMVGAALLLCASFIALTYVASVIWLFLLLTENV
jgi:hypothetical protein